MTPKTVLVAGGGLAGIAAATALADHGYRVTLLERRQVLGGRASAFPLEDGWLDNCQHVILGSCVNLIHLLDRLGTLPLVTFHQNITFLADGKTTRLSPSPLPTPFHFLPHFLKAPLFTIKEKIKIVKLFSRLLFLNPREPSLDRITLLDWLVSLDQSSSVIEKFWNLVFVSSLNETLERTSAKYGVMVLKETFLRHAHEALFGTPNVSLSELYHTAARQLFANADVTVRQANVKEILPEGEPPSLVIDTGEILSADALISALPFYNLLPVLSERLRNDSFFSRVRNLETSPILGIHLWFDQPFTPLPFGALSGSPIHWFFAKPPENQAFYIQLVVSACRPFMEASSQELVDLGVQELSKYFPKAGQARLIQSKVVRETRATFSPAPGCDRFRLPQKTPLTNFYLAGDWTDTGWPATMEGAVRSGYRAAEAVLRSHGNRARVEIEKLPKGSVLRLTNPKS